MAPTEEADSLAPITQQITRELWGEPLDDGAGTDAGADASSQDAWRPIAVPVAGPHAAASASVAPRRDDTYSVVSRRVYTLAAKAENLAARGAYFAARAEIVKALRAITQALDAQRSATSHSESLARAMRAFQEAEDFAPRGSQLEADMNLTQTISGHRTPVLKDVQVDHMTPLVAQQRYLEYAQEQFALACDDLPAASYSLYALARVYTLMEHAQQDAQALCLPKAMTLHQAALLVDARNAKAANELGVLLARFGQLEDARRVLRHALTLRPEPQIWRNLAVVHRRLGDAELARRADEEGISLARRISVPQESDGALPVQWVDPGTFSHVRSALEP
jgi:tetratricopeptide (TPR) repeat protein